MRRIAGVLGLTALALTGVLAGVFLPSGGASPTAVDATTRVTVKMSEFKFVFSRRSVPTGTVIFTVVNKGKITHDFKIAGKKTRVLLPGKSQILRVKIAKKGRYAFLCTLVGHAGAGMKGRYAVGTTPVTTTTTKPPTTTTQPPPPPPPTGTVGNVNTSATVGMFEYGFNLSQNPIASGQITFAIKNDGKEIHNYSITSQKVGKFLNPGESETWTIGLPPGRYEIICDVPFHAGQGMQGILTITG